MWKFKTRTSTLGAWMLHQFHKNNLSAKIIVYSDKQSILCRLHHVYVCIFDREKMCLPIEIDNKRALMSCCFCSFHHFGRLFSLMFIISLDLCPIGSWLLWRKASCLRISYCVTKSSLKQLLTSLASFLVNGKNWKLRTYSSCSVFSYEKYIFHYHPTKLRI